MKNFHLTLFTFLLLFCSSELLAQDPPYILLTTTDNYTNLENPTEVTSVGDEWDDPSFTFPIGFDFTFMGETNNTLIMNDDFLGGAVSFPPSPDGIYNVLFAHFTDIIDREASDSTLQSSISYSLKGNAGEQIFKLEWKDVAFYNEWSTFGTAENIMNLQLWIYEGSNNFEIRFGPSNYTDTLDLIHDADGPTCGIMDSLDLNPEAIKTIWHLSGDPLNPTLNNVNNIDDIYITDMLSDNPADGMVYQFINSLSATEDFAQSNAMKVYPSLVSNQFFVEVNEDVLSEKTTFALNDQLGRPVFNKTITDVKTEFSLGHLPTGFYYATIFNKNGLGTEKIFVMKN